jgi:hypothetical protein
MTDNADLGREYAPVMTCADHHQTLHKLFSLSALPSTVASSKNSWEGARGICRIAWRHRSTNPQDARKRFAALAPGERERLTEPIHYDAASHHHMPVGWEETLVIQKGSAERARELRAKKQSLFWSARHLGSCMSCCASVGRSLASGRVAGLPPGSSGLSLHIAMRILATCFDSLLSLDSAGRSGCWSCAARPYLRRTPPIISGRKFPPGTSAASVARRARYGAP